MFKQANLLKSTAQTIAMKLGRVVAGLSVTTCRFIKFLLKLFSKNKCVRGEVGTLETGHFMS